MRVLFICNMNMHRSPAAAQLFKDRFETRSAGLFGGKLVRKSDLNWADAIVVMEPEQRIELVKRFPSECLQKKLLCLDVPDIYSYQQPELIEVLKAKSDALVQ